MPEGADFDPLDIVAPSFSEEEEREIGFAFDRQLAEQVEVVDDPLIAGFIDELGRNVLARAGPQPFVYRFRVIRDPSLNAFAVFGGYVYFHSGTLAAAGSLDELAGVMGHEIAHVRLRHHAKLRERGQLPELVGTLAGLATAAVTGEPGALAATQGVNVALQLRFSREFEAEADRQGTSWMADAGYDPRGIARFFERLIERKRADAERIPPYLYSHPDVERRIDAVEVYARDSPPALREQGPLDARFRAAQSRLAMLAAEGGSRVIPTANRRAEPGSLFDAAERARAAENPARAAALYEQTLALDPTRALVFVRLGEAYEDLHEPERAVYAYEQAQRRAGPGALRQRALRAAERLSFPVVESAELSGPPGSGALVWTARLGSRFRERSDAMRVHWLGPEGTPQGTSPVERDSRAGVRAELALPSDASGTWSAELRLDGRPVARSTTDLGRGLSPP